MTTLTVNITDNNDLPVLQEILTRFGLSYTVDNDYLLSENEVKGLTKTKQDFIDGKTTARDWSEVEDDLNRAFN